MDPQQEVLKIDLATMNFGLTAVNSKGTQKELSSKQHQEEV